MMCAISGCVNATNQHKQLLCMSDEVLIQCFRYMYVEDATSLKLSIIGAS